MTLGGTLEVRVPPERVVARLHDLEGWADWAPGLLALDLEPQPDGRVDLILALRAPRTLHLRLSVDRVDDGLEYVLVEGDASAVAGRVRAVATDDGARIRWEHELEFPVTIPGPLLREIEAEVAPRWLEALVRGL